MFNKLYHASSIKLSPNSIIEGGLHPLNIDKGTPFAYNNYNYIFIEMLLEIVRLDKFSNKPKRSQSVFVCDKKNQLELFLKQHRQNLNLYCYEVEPIDDNFNYHIGDFNYHGLADKMNDNLILKNIKFKDFYSYAEKYWSKEPNPETTEIVLNSPIKIIKEFDI